MLPLRHARRWQLASVAILSVVMTAAMMPEIWIWKNLSRSGIPLYDKWLHLTTFLALLVWFSGQYKPASYWRIVLGLLSFGILIEICQRMVSYRSGEWADLLADVLGIVLGLIIAVAGVGGWSLRFEQWVQDRAEPI